MSKQNKNQLQREATLKLHLMQLFGDETLHSLKNYDVRLTDEVWRLSAEHKVAIFKTASKLKLTLVEGFYQTMKFFAVNYSPSHVQNMNQRLNEFLDVAKDIEILESALLNYRATLDKTNEWKLGSLKGFLLKWDTLGFAGLTSEAVELLNQWRFKGNQKGHNVMTLHPKKGPLTDSEHLEFIKAVPQLFSQNQLSIQEFAIAWLHSFLPVRKAQTKYLKICDLVIFDGDESGELLMPRAKLRSRRIRSEFTKYPLESKLFRVLRAQAKAVKQNFLERCSHASEDVLNNLPLFPNQQFFEEDNLESLIQRLDRDDYCIKSSSIDYILRKVCQKANVIGRDGEILNITINRFKDTIATNLAREGESERVIAKALDHSDEQNAYVYTQRVKRLNPELDKNIAIQIGFMSQAFKAAFETREQQAQETLSEKVISHEHEILGQCLYSKECYANTECCYVCEHFAAKATHAHEKLLDDMIIERKNLDDRGLQERILSAKDPLIYAVADAVKQVTNGDENG